MTWDGLGKFFCHPPCIRNLRKNLNFAAKPSVIAFLGTFVHQKVNNKECQCCPKGKGQSGPN